MVSGSCGCPAGGSETSFLLHRLSKAEGKMEPQGKGNSGDKGIPGSSSEKRGQKGGAGHTRPLKDLEQRPRLGTGEHSSSYGLTVIPPVPVK